MENDELTKNKSNKSNFFLYVFGFIGGILGGLLGTGGGMIIVPALKKCGISPKIAHAISISTVLPICLISALIYLINGKVTIPEVAPYVPSGVIGCLIGCVLLQKLNYHIIKKVFGMIILWVAIKMLFY